MKTNKILALLLVLIISVSALLGACGSDKNYPVTVGHLTLKESPVKIVSLSDNITDIICYMGYATKLSGVSDDCTQEEITKYVTSVGDATSPNVDLIINSGATIVFTDKDLDQNTAKKLKDNNINVIKTLYPATDAQLKNLYETIGTVLGGDTDGRQKGLDAYERLMSALTAAQSEVQAAGATKTVCYLYVNEEGKLCSLTGDVNNGMVLSYLGAVNVASNFTSEYADESILKLSNPDYIFFDKAIVMERISKSNSLQNMNAIKNGNVYELSKAELFRQGETLVKIQNFMLSSMFPNYVDAPQVKSEDISHLYNITLKDDMSYKIEDDYEDIIAIQQRLVDLGYLDLGEEEPTSYFGSMTEEALKSFQSANSLEPSGIAGYETLTRLFKSDALGASGETFVPETEPPQTETTAPSSDSDETTAPADEDDIPYEAGPITITDSTVYQYGDDSEDIIAIQERLVELLYLSFDEGDSATTYYGSGTESAIMNFQESNGLSVTGIADAETLTLLFSDNAQLPQ